VCQVDDSRCGSEVVLQIDDLRIGSLFELFPQLGNNFDLRTAKSVNGLPMIANRSELPGFSDQQCHQLALHRIDVLDFIDAEMNPGLGDLGATLGIGLETTDKFGLRCAEIEKPPAAEVCVISCCRASKSGCSSGFAYISHQRRLLAPLLLFSA